MTDRMITVPSHARLLVIPHEYLAICYREKTGRIARGERKGEIFTYREQDEAAAALLYLIERWALHKMKEASGKPDWTATWVYMSTDQIQDYEFWRAFGASRVAKGFELLEALGYVTKRNNPNNPTDRTYQYRFEKEAVQSAVDSLSPFFSFEEWKLQNRKMQPLGSKNAFFEIEETIPHDPTHDPTQSPPQEELTTSPDGEPSAHAEAGESSEHQTPGEPATPTINPEPRPRDAIFDLVITRGFGLALTDKAGIASVRRKAGWISTWLKGDMVKENPRDKKATFPGCNPPITLSELNDFYDWYDTKRDRDGQPIGKPSTAPSMALNVGQFRNSEMGGNQSERSGAETDADEPVDLTASEWEGAPLIVFRPETLDEKMARAEALREAEKQGRVNEYLQERQDELERRRQRH